MKNGVQDTKSDTVKQCEACNRNGAGSCSRAVCPRRKPVTADVPDGSTNIGTGSSYKNPIRYDE